MKELYGASKFSDAISKAAENIATRVLKRYKDRGVSGREEDISSGLAGELTDHLLDEIKKELASVSVKGLDFDAITYKKKTENKVGADIAGSIIYKNFDGADSAKVFLVQAKVASSAKQIDKHTIELKAGDKRLLKQCNDMLKITPAAFVFIYSKFGVHVVPANTVSISGVSKINTKQDYYKGLGNFYEEVYKCFIGDLKLGNLYRDEERMKELCEELKSQRGLAVTVTKNANKAG